MFFSLKLPRDLHPGPQLMRHRLARFRVQIEQDLHVVGEEADGVCDDILDAAFLDRFEVVIDVRFEPWQSQKGDRQFEIRNSKFEIRNSKFEIRKKVK